MRYIKTYKESSSYLNLHGDDNYEITLVKRDNNHDYGYCDGVLYELSGNDTTLSIDEIEHTPENTFYQDQVDRYKEYIQDGGILQTFPVDINRKANNLQDMLEYLDDADDGFDIMYDLFKGNPWDKPPRTPNEKMYGLNLYDLYTEPVEFGFDEDALVIGEEPFKSIRTVEDLREVYHNDYVEPEKDDFKDDEVYEEAKSEWETKMELYDDDILCGLEDIIKHFENDVEYTLTDFNHRFQALKELGKTQVYVEEM